MDAAHIHLMLNHFPIAGVAFAIPLLLYAWWRRNEIIGRAAMVLLVLTGLVTIPTFLTGEPAEEIIEHLPGISEHMIKVHEESAETTVWFIGAAAIIALLSLIIAERKTVTPKWAIPLLTLLSFVSMGFLAWTNNLGGQISHPEIRKSDTTSHPSRPEKKRNSDSD